MEQPIGTLAVGDHLEQAFQDTVLKLLADQT